MRKAVNPEYTKCLSCFMLIAERTQKVILVYVRFFMDGNIKYVGTIP
jgi:hypothetical protein